MTSYLNKKQKEFVTFPAGPLIAIAGPGTGKTHCLIEKIKYNSSKKILALTFTNKAASEIKERLGKQDGVAIHTFHSFCLEVLKKRNSFKIIPQFEQLLIAQNLKQKYSLTKSSKQILYNVSSQKNSKTGSTLLSDYNQQLDTNNYLDYDDLIDKTISLNKKYIPTFDLILVDEFQDTNARQFDLINHIASNDNVAVIGDPNQSIYSFRGSNTEIFTNFKHQFPQFKEVVFDINYRSSKLIVNLANDLFPNYKLNAASHEHGDLKVVNTPTRLSEAKYIFNIINEKVGGIDLLKASDYSANNFNCHFKDFAIIYRKHIDGKLIRKILDEEGIPLQQLGQESLFNTLNAQKMISALSNLKPRSKPLISYQRTVKDLGYEVQEIFELCERFADKHLSDLLDYVRRISELGYWDYLGDKVTLCTIHSSKGLEFNYVFIAQFNAHNFPQKGSDENEEKRLFYVAITRAKQGLYLFSCGKQSKYKKFVGKHAISIRDDKGFKSLERLHIKKLKQAQTSLF